MKVRTAGEGLVVNTLMMPMGNDSVMSPVIFTMHLPSTATGFILLQLPHVAESQTTTATSRTALV